MGLDDTWNILVLFLFLFLQASLGFVVKHKSQNNNQDVDTVSVCTLSPQGGAAQRKQQCLKIQGSRPFPDDFG